MQSTPDDLPPVVLPDKRKDEHRRPREAAAPRRTPPRASGQSDRQDNQEAFDRYDAVLRFLIGATLEGQREFVNRLETWEQTLRPEVRQKLNAVAASPTERVRYLLIGLAFEGQSSLRETINALVAFTYRGQQQAWAVLDRVMDIPLLKPLKQRMERSSQGAQETIERLIWRGVWEETLGRDVARGALDEIVNEFVDYLTDNPEVNEMIQKQSADLASSVVIGAREISITADEKLEELVRTILRRRPRNQLRPRMNTFSRRIRRRTSR